MADACFISYHRPDRDVAVYLQRQLEAKDVEVFLYDPETLWGDPVTIIVEALMEVDIVLNLNPTAPSPWKKAELRWSSSNGRPIIESSLQELGSVVESIANASRQPPSDLLRGTRFVRIHKIMHEHVNAGLIEDSDFFNMEDWFLLRQIEPLIPELNQLFALMRRDEDGQDDLAMRMGAKLGHLFNEFEDLAKYLQLASAAHPLVFAGKGLAMTGNYDLAKLSLYSTEELEKILPMGLERLRGLRDGTLGELPRI